MKKEFVRQARLPRGAFTKSLEEVLAVYKNGVEKRKEVRHEGQAGLWLNGQSKTTGDSK